MEWQQIMGLIGLFLICILPFMVAPKKHKEDTAHYGTLEGFDTNNR